MTTSSIARKRSTALDRAGISFDEQRRRGKAYAKLRDWKGSVGGWFHDENGKPVAQGFADLYALLKRDADAALAAAAEKPAATMEREDAGEDGIRVERVIVTERNAAEQVTREVDIERTFEDGIERQTTVRVVGYDTLTSKAHDVRPADRDEARRYIADAEHEGLLTKPTAAIVGSKLLVMEPQS